MMSSNMSDSDRRIVIEKVSAALVWASSAFSDDRVMAYKQHIETDSSALACWAMKTILDNAAAAEENQSPLCDDTGIPHLIFEVGNNRYISGEILDAVYDGVKKGLRELPGRPMAVLGDDVGRIEQKYGLDSSSDAVVPAPFMVKYADEDPDCLRLTIMMQGGGPEIRSKTYRVFHKHNMQVVVDEVVEWAKEVVGQLGCTPTTLAVGIGRSHFEASSMMLQAMAEGDCGVQSEIERQITDRVNEAKVGPLGFGGESTVLATFLKVGPQRASGVRIVCMRPCCCFEPRKAVVDL